MVAGKSPLTGGYVDGNLGTQASPNLKSGLDAVVITGKAEKPGYLLTKDDDIEISDATYIWSLVAADHTG